jgi:hypothetical protein
MWDLGTNSTFALGPRKIIEIHDRVLQDRLLNCWWPSPAQWFLVPSPTELITIFYSLTPLEDFSQNQSQNYITTNGQSASLFFVSSPNLGPKTNFFSQTLEGLLMWSALSVERTVMSFTTADGPRQRSHSRARVPRDSWRYFSVSDSRLPQPSGPSYHYLYPPLPGTGFPFQYSQLPLALASTVIGFRPRRDAWPYICSFQASICFEMGPPFWQEEGSDWSLPLYWGVTLLSFTLTHSLSLLFTSPPFSDFI